ncbi:plasmid replication protein RepC [Agrobacterium pusense]|uniref:plasmid replication protein RepC n=1 Tax=Agrobacterium pusense TaxID=648995 RepID=UPI0021D0A230|nr:plasmid replication protein RepC [Agrobacterium pusense]UXT93293.1 replication protein C [Agrobacterium pusense]
MGTPFNSTRPTGRKITPDRVRYLALAEQTELGIVQRSDLAILVDKLICTGLVNSTETTLLRCLINTAPKKAFEKNGRPVVFKSNRQLSFEIGRSENRVSAILSRLFDRGLITMQDSGNYKRYSERSLEGGATEACGIDLRILVARYSELSELVRTTQQEEAATNAAARRYRGSLRMVRNLIDEAEGVAFQVAAKLQRRLQRIIDRVGKPARAPSAVLHRATSLLEWIAKRISGVAKQQEQPSCNENIVCLYRENDKHIQNTNPYPNLSGNDERRSATAEQHNLQRAGYASKGAFEESLCGEAEGDKRPMRQSDGLVALSDLLRAAPVITQTWGFRVRTWADLMRALPDMAVVAGISPDARDRAIKQMGQQAAAVAIAVTLQKQDMQEVTSPGGYLRAMTERAAAGTLHLTRSVHALVNRNIAEARI